MKVACPCCDYLTLGEPEQFEICAVCFWEDEYRDGYQIGPIKFPGTGDLDAPSPSNDGLTLNQARANYQQFGACDERCRQFVRPPLPEEIPA